MAAQANSDVFGSYLKTIRDREAERVKRGRDPATVELEILRVLKVAAEQGDNHPLRQLISKTRLPPSSLIDTINKMAQSELVEFDKKDKMRITITSLGEEIAG